MSIYASVPLQGHKLSDDRDIHAQVFIMPDNARLIASAIIKGLCGPENPGRLDGGDPGRDWDETPPIETESVWAKHHRETSEPVTEEMP